MKKVIKGWDQAVVTMRVGEKSIVTCPPQFAYGAKGAGRGKIPPDSTLQFEIELLKVEDEAPEGVTLFPFFKVQRS